MPIKSFAVTQGGNDAAAETTIPTGIQPGVTMDAWELRSVEYTISPTLMKAWVGSGDAEFVLQLTKRAISPIARLTNYSDTDLIAQDCKALLAVGTVASAFITDCTFLMKMSPGIIVYGENLYIQVISAGSGAANQVYGRITYELKKLTQAQALAVVASRP